MGMGGDGINIYNLDCLVGMKDLGDESIDLITTDPPYGISFMGKDWDKALPSIDIWRECLRVLKDGAFAFVMSIPRSDCLSRMIISLEDAGFNVGFSPIYWVYASGFPKAKNIGKAVDKRLGTYIKGEVSPNSRNSGPSPSGCYGEGVQHKTIDFPQCSQAKALDGSYGGFQPKPAVEVIIVAMKPLSEKTFVDQALKNQKGITWLDDCRIPYDKEPIAKRDLIKQKSYTGGQVIGSEGDEWKGNPQGRFPANLLVSDDVLNDGQDRKAGSYKGEGSKSGGIWHQSTGEPAGREYGDSGSFSRYFDLDKWAQTLPFLIVPKASKSEKNKGLGNIEPTQTNDGRNKLPDNAFQRGKTYRNNPHPTVKPVKLFSYLVTLGSRAGDVVLDPFGGTMTTAVACAMLGREFIGYEIDAGSYDISQGRVKAGWQIKLEALGGKG